ncbi:YhcN/YlaJ family sporulation lipoprotein [Salicibibacter cibarius]|uniref:YhcN/YlaJ family sporulation lipoprotein n=1 Tax=Salicibibacter cibarius TaxID=2743000 RepID=A0A7T7CB73_9BACI|nr:YhcN/YlaJ family sporulation lipoprotein [Salicibibacter cibarius]QQK75647.1 YhcN/YlaJ family sporulation lipoprotein [Salicibibacter cibarius]
MKKMALSLAAFSVITAGVAGCGNADDNAAGPGNNTGMNQLGNQQNEQQDVGYAGWDRTDRGDRGEGPITDMFTVDDRQGQQQQGNGTGGQNQTMDRPGGMMNNNNNGENGNGEQSEIQQTVSDMDNVENSHVVVDDDHVLVGVRTSGNNGDETVDNIREELEDETDKEVYVSDDEDIYDDIRGVENDLAEGTGEALDETGATIEGIIEDLSDAAQRPFERSR